MSETLKVKAYEIIESTINCLSEKAYDRLGDIVSVDDSWADGETMDFWFEIRFEAEGDVIKTAVFNVNV